MLTGRRAIVYRQGWHFKTTFRQNVRVCVLSSVVWNPCRFCAAGMYRRQQWSYQSSQLHCSSHQVRLCQQDWKIRNFVGFIRLHTAIRPSFVTFEDLLLQTYTKLTTIYWNVRLEIDFRCWRDHAVTLAEVFCFYKRENQARSHDCQNEETGRAPPPLPFPLLPSHPLRSRPLKSS